MKLNKRILSLVLSVLLLATTCFIAPVSVSAAGLNTDWTNIASDGSVDVDETVSKETGVGTSVSYKNYPDDEYLSKISYEFGDLTINSDGHPYGKEMRLIYHIDQKAGTYYYVAYRFNWTDGGIYALNAAIGMFNGEKFAAQTTSDFDFSDKVNLRDDWSGNSAKTNKTASAPMFTNVGKGHTVDVEYITSSKVKFTFYDKYGDKDSGVFASFTIESKISTAEFKTAGNQFEFEALVPVQFKSITPTFTKVGEGNTTDKFRNDYAAVLALNETTVAIPDKVLIQNALDDLDKNYSTQVKSKLKEEKQHLESLLVKISELEIQENGGYIQPTVEQGFKDDFQSGKLDFWTKTAVERYANVSTQVGEIQNKGINFEMEIVDDPTDSTGTTTNKVLKLNGMTGSAIPYSFATPKNASLSTVKYEVLKFETVHWGLRIIPAFVDQNNFSVYELTYENEVWNYRSHMYRDATGVDTGKGSIEKGLDLSLGFTVEINYDINALMASITIIPYQDKDKTISHRMQIPSPQSKFVLPSLYNGWTPQKDWWKSVWYDDVSVSYTKGDWDEDVAVVDPVVYYTGNSRNDPGDTVQVTGANLGAVVNKAEIVQVDNATDKAGYILQNTYDNIATEAKFTDPSYVEDVFEAKKDEAVQVNIIQRSNEGIKFILPTTLKKGIYAIKLTPNSPLASPAYVYMNRPDIDYTVGDQGEIVTAGGEIQIIGKLLALDGVKTEITDKDQIAQSGVKVQIKKSENATPIDCEVVNIQSKYSVSVKIPEGTDDGKYELTVYNGYGDNTCWAKPIEINVGPSPFASRPDDVFNVVDYGADPSKDNTNDQPAIVKALEAAALNGGGTVYFPKGVYIIRYSLVIPENVHFKGEGKDETFISFSSITYDFGELPDAVIYVTDNVEISDMTLYCRRVKNNIKATVTNDTDPISNVHCHDLYIRNTPTKGSITNGAGGELMLPTLECQLLLAEEMNTGNVDGFSFRAIGDGSYYNGKSYDNIRIERTKFEGSQFFWMSAENSVVQDNIINQGYQGFRGAYTKYLGEHNIYSNNSNGVDSSAAHGGTFEGNGMYMGGNDMGYIQSNNGEIMTNDGEMNYGGYHKGIIKKDESDPTGCTYLITTGESYPENRWYGSQLYVQEGQGQLQYRTIVYNKGNKLVFDSPFIVEPNRNSRVAIEDGRADLYMVNSSWEKGSHVGSYGTQVGTVMDGNELSHCRGLVQRTHGQGPNWYTVITENTLTDMFFHHFEGVGREHTEYGGIFLTGDGQDNDFYGITIRDNFLSQGTIQLNGYKKGHLSDTVIDNNTFTNHEYGITFTVSQADSITGCLITRCTFDEITYPIAGKHRNEQSDVYSDSYRLPLESYDKYGIPHIYLYDPADFDPSALILGDVNMDGVVDDDDVTLVRKYLVGKTSFTEMMRKRADYDQSALVNFLDALLIYRKVHPSSLIIVPGDW